MLFSFSGWKFSLFPLIIPLYDCFSFLLFTDERESVQKKTFTKWVNSHLIRVGCRISDLYTDLRDGKMILKLLEVLSGERLVRFHSTFFPLPCEFPFVCMRLNDHLFALFCHSSFAPEMTHIISLGLSSSFSLSLFLCFVFDYVFVGVC